VATILIFYHENQLTKFRVSLNSMGYCIVIQTLNKTETGVYHLWRFASRWMGNDWGARPPLATRLLPRHLPITQLDAGYSGDVRPITRGWLPWVTPFTIDSC